MMIEMNSRVAYNNLRFDTESGTIHRGDEGTAVLLDLDSATTDVEWDAGFLCSVPTSELIDI